ncbi:hypothetical protein D9613_001276 [Agrocybe pediades]|uniref:Uncharacterized protein n=1 Tax=Agrocybe pediades TaxID=84607 RepID=A0A8H4VXW4_9AGAR|nr:hypothetical protein D9613_001276 [Agrocybe pediades]
MESGPDVRRYRSQTSVSGDPAIRSTLYSPPSSSSLDHLLLPTAVSFALSLSVSHKLELYDEIVSPNLDQLYRTRYRRCAHLRRPQLVPRHVLDKALQHTSPRSMSSRSPSDFASFHEIRIAAAFPLDQGSLKELRMVYELINPATQDLRRQ